MSNTPSIRALRLAVKKTHRALTEPSVQGEVETLNVRRREWLAAWNALEAAQQEKRHAA